MTLLFPYSEASSDKQAYNGSDHNLSAELAGFT